VFTAVAQELKPIDVQAKHYYGVHYELDTVIWLLFFYTERHKSLRIHTQRSACLTLCGSFKINDSNGEYAIYYDAVYINKFS
jgi:hypothetical protein